METTFYKQIKRLPSCLHPPPRPPRMLVVSLDGAQPLDFFPNQAGGEWQIYLFLQSKRPPGPFEANSGAQGEGSC